MNALILLILVGMALGSFASLPHVLWDADCDPKCHVYLQTSRTTFISGLEYTLDSPSIFIDRAPAACENLAASAGWLVAKQQSGERGFEWIEAGVTSGYIKGVGCTSKLNTYYGYNMASVGVDPTYRETLVNDGRVDPGDDVDVKIQVGSDDQQLIQVFVTTPDYSIPFPTVQFGMDKRNRYHANFGIEGTVSAADDYSTIPMSKFTNMKIKSGNFWIILPTNVMLDTPDTRDGYMGQKCRNNSFVAGTVTSIDCNVIATRNSDPLPVSKTVQVSSARSVPITLDATDHDRDYLTFKLVDGPTIGTSRDSEF